LLLVAGVARDDVGAGQPGQVVRALPQFIGQQIGLEARFSDLVRFGLFGGHAEQGQQADDGERQAK
jgi:hypothetical protein